MAGSPINQKDQINQTDQPKEAKMANVTKVGEIFKCEICGNVVEVKEVGGGELVCCGQPMKKIN